MDEATAAQYIKILQSAQQLNIKDPTALARAKKILQFANSLKGKQVPPALNAELMRFYDSVGARPEVAGIKTTVQGNRWEQSTMSPIIFKAK